MKMCARDLRRHQVHVVIEGHRQQDVSFADAGFALNVYIDAVALNKLDAFKPRSPAKTAGLFVYNGDLVASIEKSCYCS
jgi:hypothetical protein